ncbi:unnamed protein product, partial [Mesorhabditis belari]|uniref:G-protein coupled receptors family 1 profile domain-containing protein n=1 Tax=Mesorhabditis belari TaxID=2138241 RepID=A0AAF3EV49_9BILA
MDESEEGCVDLRSIMWKNESDITVLPGIQTIFGFLYSVLITLGVVGNSLVVISVLQNKALQSVRNVFIFSLSCSDIVVSIVSGSITPIYAFSKIWLFGPQLCQLVPLIQGTSLCFSTLTLTAISIDRFFLIIFPTRRSIQMWTAVKLVAFNASLAFAVSIPMYLQQKLFKYQNYCGEICSEQWEDESAQSIYGTLVFIIQFVLPLLIITFCYAMISIKLSKGVLVRAEEGVLTEQRKNAMKRRLRTNRMLIAMVGVFFCCWLPSVAFNFLRDYEWLPKFVSRQKYFFGVLTHCISMSSTVWNPILYALLNEQFRIAFASLLHTCRRRDGTFKVCDDRKGFIANGVERRGRQDSRGSIPRNGMSTPSDDLLIGMTKEERPKTLSLQKTVISQKRAIFMTDTRSSFTD